jgi:hypothetical protein
MHVHVLYPLQLCLLSPSHCMMTYDFHPSLLQNHRRSTAPPFLSVIICKWLEQPVARNVARNHHWSLTKGILIYTDAHSLIPLVNEYGSTDHPICMYMYIVGEGLKRPQRRDHLWSIVLTDYPNFGGLHHHITILLCTANNIKNTGDLVGIAALWT